MRTSEFKVTAVIVTLVAATLLYLLGLAFPNHGDVVMPIASGLIGGIVTTLLLLCAPAPVMQIPLSLALAMLAGSVPQTSAEAVNPRWDWRENVLVLAIIVGGFILMLAWMFGDQHAKVVLNIAAGYVGGIGVIMRELVAPRPDPSVPAEAVLEWQRQSRG